MCFNDSLKFTPNLEYKSIRGLTVCVTLQLVINGQGG